MHRTNRSWPYADASGAISPRTLSGKPARLPANESSMTRGWRGSLQVRRAAQSRNQNSLASLRDSRRRRIECRK